MPDTINDLAHSLIATHGTDAMAMAEKASANVLKLNLPDRANRWARVITAIQKLQAADHREVL